MLDVFKVAQLLVSHAVGTCPDEVDLIGYYGSQAQGTASASSDLDIFFIPADGRTPPVARTFLIDGILFDFWAITWETMEGFATGRLRGWSLAPAIVHHAKILHARGPQQVERLQALKQKIIDLQQPQARVKMIRRAMAAFPQVLAHLGNLRLAVSGGDLADVRHAGWQVIGSAYECLALANQALLSHGLGRVLEQVQLLPARPANMEQMIAAISTSLSRAHVFHS